MNAKDDNLGIIANDISYMKRDISEIKNTVQHGYVPIERFAPVEKIVYGLVGLILVGVGGAFLTLILKR